MPTYVTTSEDWSLHDKPPDPKEPAQEPPPPPKGRVGKVSWGLVAATAFYIEPSNLVRYLWTWEAR